MSINLLIPAFEVPPSQLAANWNRDMHNTIGRGRSNPLTEPGRRLPITLPNPNPQRVTRCMNLPPSQLLKRLHCASPIPIEPACWPYDPATSTTGCDGKSAAARAYECHRIPSHRDQLDPLNLASERADAMNKLVDLFV